jgi:hypothetical protein
MKSRRDCTSHRAPPQALATTSPPQTLSTSPWRRIASPSLIIKITPATSFPDFASVDETIFYRRKQWRVPLWNWTVNMSFSKLCKKAMIPMTNSGRGQADDSLPGTGAGNPRSCLSSKGGHS